MTDDRRTRRRFLVSTGAALTGLLAGCTSDAETGDGGSGSDATTDAGTATSTSTAAESTPTATTTGEETPEEGSGESPYEVEIVYDGEWTGSIATGESSRSIQGTGEKTIAIDGDPSMLSANAQKEDDGGGELAIRILKGGEVAKEASTSAEYGVAQVSTSALDSAGGSGGQGSKLAVRVVYDGEWQGSISAGGSSRSVEGSGEKTIEIEGSPDIVSANAQKKDDGSGELTIQLLKDGEVVKEASTSAEYGMAQISKMV